MPNSVFTESEHSFLAQLQQQGVRYMVVGANAAVLQGADAVTHDIDLWFENRADPRIAQAVRAAGGFWISGSFGMRPPAIGGDVLSDRFDVVTHMHGLGDFEAEYKNALLLEVDGANMHVLPLHRIITSKRAANRLKDQAQLPALEAALAAMNSDDAG